ncbi:MAG: SusC/RagA family TonB-linked outer membrane protein [Bacteroidota bacterium]
MKRLNYYARPTSESANHQPGEFRLLGRRWLLFSWLLLLGSMTVVAQTTVRGTVTESETGDAMAGVAVVLQGSTIGAYTDEAGAFSLQIPSSEGILMFRAYSYTTQEIPLEGRTEINVAMVSDETTLSEVVLIGYGTQKKEDLTGSIVAVNSEEFVQGNIATPEQLINGKVPGVQITPNGGAPGSGSRIRIRGGASLNANNNPLIVIDGVPLAMDDVAGAADPLSFINPNDIETFTVLKDASAAAIYGSRASNGVIIITTKKGKGSDPLRVNFSAMMSTAQRTGSVGVLNADEFRDVVNERASEDRQALMGTAATDWQDEIYRAANSQDFNLSLQGNIKGMPMRASVGFLNQNGILLNSQMDRTSASVGLTPSFFEDRLRVDINLKGALVNNDFADQGAIGAAVVFDPTQPVRQEGGFGGYFEWLDPATGNPNPLAPRNPLGLLNEQTNQSEVLRSIGNVALDYRFHFLPDLRANLNLGYDLSQSSGARFTSNEVAAGFPQGVDADYMQSRMNTTAEFYLNYNKEVEALNSRFDIMAGYSYQDFIREDSSLDLSLLGDTITSNYFKTQNTLVSFYGRFNYTLANRYLLTATLRQDGSSRFSPETRWGLFPSVALAWKMSEEAFIQQLNVFSDLKVRLGYGVTGQQELFGDYPYLARFTRSQQNAQYQFGNRFVNTFRPEGYDGNLKWEETETYNVGLDYGFWDGRIYGAVDYYFRRTRDLLSEIPIPAGSNFTNQIITNVGNIENEGVEVSVNINPIRREDFNLDFGVNLTYNQNTITNLTKVAVDDFVGIEVGGISGGVGNNIQIHSVGFPRSSFYVYQQVYDEAGLPIEGLYVDQNEDGLITPDDRYRYQQPDPNYFVGATAAVRYKNFSASTVLRGNIGNYVYNNVRSNNGVYRGVVTANNFLSNLHPDVLNANFNNNQFFSDYYMENASFLRMDNLVLGYTFDNLANGKMRLQLSAIGQNLFVITEYTGLDPEIANGIDNNLYPLPRTFSLSLNLSY